MKTNEEYVSPEITVYEVEMEGILCTSQLHNGSVEDPRSGEGSFIRGNRFGSTDY